MAKIFDKNRSRTDLYKHIGNLSQVAGIREYTYTSGWADGVKAISVNTGRLSFETLPSRCLDISHGSFKGIPFGYISKSGIRNPTNFSKNDPTSFLDNFCGGVLTTCGLHNIGTPIERDGKMHPLHGEIANSPADHVSVAEKWRGDECEFVVSGEIRHSRFYGEDMLLRRRITALLGAASFLIEDEVENQDFAPTNCFILYHANFGFPFLDAATRLVTSPLVKSEARPGIPEDRIRDFDRFAGPKDGEEEICVYHTFKPNADGFATACLFNPELGEKGMGVYIRFDISTLPRFVQWKMLRSREYVCGLEPGSAPLDDLTPEELAAAKLQPGEKRTFRVEIGVLEGENECRRFMEG